MTFENYLYSQDYSKGTIKSYQISKEKFCSWCDTKNYNSNTVDYKSCLQYVKKLQLPKKGKYLSKSTIKHQVGALKIFFNYLVDENYRDTNPIQSINIRGVKRSLNHNLLEFEELEDLYYSYQTQSIHFPNCPAVANRNKVVTGFMVYQGMNATALKSLKLEHIDINKGVVYIPSTRKSNSRKLQLQSQQIHPLVRFLENHRQTLQDKINCYDEQLFPLPGERFFILPTLFKELKKLNHKVINAKQIRASVISYWLQHHNIRQVQYMAGHRYISSTERYLQDDLESLHEMVENFHPIS